MNKDNMQLGDDRRELTYDFYPSDRRVKMSRRTIYDQKSVNTTSFGIGQFGNDGRELTYDFFPDNRRRI
jgi:hypothetical protein